SVSQPSSPATSSRLPSKYGSTYFFNSQKLSTARNNFLSISRLLASVNRCPTDPSEWAAGRPWRPSPGRAVCKSARVKVTMLLADFAQVADGKLTVVGGGWSLTGPEPTPFGI